MRKRLPIPDPKNCIHCNEVFQPTAKYPQQRFCGHKCQFAATRGPEFNARIARESLAKRADAMRGKKRGGKANGYVKRNGRHEHRVVAEIKLGRPLIKGEIVHHDDEIKSNNNPENLIVLPSQSVHARLHRLGKKNKPESIAKSVAGRKATMLAKKDGVK